MVLDIILVFKFPITTWKLSIWICYNYERYVSIIICLLTCLFVRRVLKKESRVYNIHNFNTFKHIFETFGRNHPDTPFYHNIKKIHSDINISLRSADVLWRH